MKVPPGWYFTYYDGQSLWLDGTRKRDPDPAIVQVIIAKVNREISKTMPVRGQLEILENGEAYFWPEVDDAE